LGAPLVSQGIRDESEQLAQDHGERRGDPALDGAPLDARGEVVGGPGGAGGRRGSRRRRHALGDAPVALQVAVVLVPSLAGAAVALALALGALAAPLPRTDPSVRLEPATADRARTLAAHGESTAPGMRVGSGTEGVGPCS